jgi:hypothetical protein
MLERSSKRLFIVTVGVIIIRPFVIVVGIKNHCEKNFMFPSLNKSMHFGTFAAACRTEFIFVFVKKRPRLYRVPF